MGKQNPKLIIKAKQLIKVQKENRRLSLMNAFYAMTDKKRPISDHFISKLITKIKIILQSIY
jgi:hypothetical protein